MGARRPSVADEVVDAWIAGMPSSTEEIIIVSLLGRKPDGLSEFSYYSFRGGFDQPDDKPGSPTWQEWLTERYGCKYRVYEFPTVDTKPITEDVNILAAKAISGFMQAGKTVVVVDSGGIGRTGKVISTLRKKMDMPLIEKPLTPRCP